MDTGDRTRCLWGFNGSAGAQFGNIWTGAAFTSYYDNYNFAPGEWGHVALGWDGTYLIMYVNGIPNTYMLFDGPRVSPGTGGTGPLFVGGSDHDNITAKLAFLRGWDTYNPRAVRGYTWDAFVPERFPYRYDVNGNTGLPVPCDFYCDYTAPSGSTCLDTSPAGYNSGGGYRTLHHGVLGDSQDTNGVQIEVPMPEIAWATSTYNIIWACSPLPAWVVDSGSPMNQILGTSPAPTGTVLTPRTVPTARRSSIPFSGPTRRLLFRAIQLWAPRKAVPWGHSRGINRERPPPIIARGAFSRAWLFRFLQELLWPGSTLAARPRTSASRAIPSSFLRRGHRAIPLRSEPPQSLSGSKIRATIGCSLSARTPIRLGPQGNLWWQLINVVAGATTELSNGLATSGTNATIRVTTSGSTITLYYGTDGVPGTWTQLVQVTSSVLETATGAGLTSVAGLSGCLSAMARYINFTAF